MFINFRKEISAHNVSLINAALSEHEIYKVLWQSCEPWYAQSVSNRNYHNINHASVVVNSLFEIHPNPPIELLLAAMWHDAVYIPQAGGDVNEKASSAALMMSANIHLKNKKQFKSQSLLDAYNKLQKTKALIDNTSIAIHLTESKIHSTPGVLENLPYLLDADLSGLASDWETFQKNQHNIILENYGDPSNRDDVVACGTFLNKMIGTREFIYHTDTGRTKWENRAKQNIARFNIEVNSR